MKEFAKKNFIHSKDSFYEINLDEKKKDCCKKYKKKGVFCKKCPKL